MIADAIPIKVKCHSGYKADEYPKCFYIDDHQFDILEVIDCWYQGENKPDFPAANYFKVRTVSKKEFILRHEIKKDKWYLVAYPGD
jgi:hypothetical protein